MTDWYLLREIVFSVT